MPKEPNLQADSDSCTQEDPHPAAMVARGWQHIQLEHLDRRPRSPLISHYAEYERGQGLYRKVAGVGLGETTTRSSPESSVFRHLSSPRGASCLRQHIILDQPYVGSIRPADFRRGTTCRRNACANLVAIGAR